jgi:polyhydroxyalkanoate synthesis regulator phasin
MEILKNLIYAGVGLASVTTDKVKDTINDLVEKGKISDTEGKRIIDEFFKTTENTKEEFENKLKTVQDKITSTFESKSKKKETSEVMSLRKKIQELEAKLASQTTEEKPATKVAEKTAKPVAKTMAPAKKATTKKTTAK